jgi:hypothetical protein
MTWADIPFPQGFEGIFCKKILLDLATPPPPSPQTTYLKGLLVLLSNKLDVLLALLGLLHVVQIVDPQIHR